MQVQEQKKQVEVLLFKECQEAAENLEKERQQARARLEIECKQSEELLEKEGMKKAKSP